MKPLEIKKCEFKLNNLYKSIKIKENDKLNKKQLIDEKKKEIKNLHSLIRKTREGRERINEELNNLRTQVERTHGDMNKIKAGLLYKTKHEYEDMIKRFEYEMQSSSRKFSSHEESRLLNDIKTHKQGMQQLELYEDKKKVYDNLKETISTKKLEKEEYWNKDLDYKKKLTEENENLEKLKKELDEVESELVELNNTKLELKKHLEDLVRENVLKQQQARKISSEKLKITKEDEIILSMEETLRDYNKIICYFQKRLFNNEHDFELSQPSSNLNTPTSFYSKLNFLNYSSPSASFDISSFETNNEDIKPVLSASSSSFDKSSSSSPTQVKKLEHPKSLFLRKTTKSEDYTASQTPIILTQTPTYPLLPTIITPNEESSSNQFINNQNALYLLKKKDDELFFNSYNNKTNYLNTRRRSSKKPKQNKVSHSADVINLLSKLNIPIQLSSQLEECLKLLKQRREEVENELNLYKASQESLKKAETNENNDNKNFMNGNIIKNDTQSLDSNYESDTNSITNPDANLLNENSPENFDQVDLEIDEDEHNNLTITQSSNLNILHKFISKQTTNNSDDSDTTLYDNSLLSKRKNSKSNSSTNSNSDKTMTPPPKSPIIDLQSEFLLNKLIKDDQHYDNVIINDNNTKFNATTITTTTTTTNNNNNNNKIISNQFSRQLSDGYSSSCTPLSASSINSEQANLNPFFRNANIENK